MSDPKFKTEYGISRLIRYTAKRQSFFDALHRQVLIVNTVAGSSAFVTLLADRPQAAIWLTALVAIGSALDNAVGFAERAQKYASLRSRYYDLYCEVVAKREDAFNAEHFRQKRLRIDGDGPPRKRVLDVICRNEEDVFRGYAHDDTIYIGPVRYALRHLVDLPPRHWKTVKEHRGVNKASQPVAAPETIG